MRHFYIIVNVFITSCIAHLNSNSLVQGCVILIKSEDKAVEEACRTFLLRPSLLIWFSTLSFPAVFLPLLSCVLLWFITAETSPYLHLTQLSTSVCVAHDNLLLLLLLPLSPPPTGVVDLHSWGLCFEIIPVVLYLFHHEILFFLKNI